MPLPNLIQEHGRLNLASSSSWATLCLAVIYAVVIFSVLPRRPKTTWLLPLVFFVLTILRVRNAPLFAITVALALPDMLLNSRLAKWLQARQWLSIPSTSTLSPGARARQIPLNFAKLLPPLAVVAVALSLQIAGISLPIFGQGWARFDSTRWPLELLPELQKINEKASPADQRIFNDLRFGGFLSYHTPQLKIFIDDRCPLYGSAFLAAYDRARRQDPGQIDRWHEQYQFHYALVETGSPFDLHLRQSSQWILLGRSAAAALYRFNLGFPSNIN